MKLPLKSWEEHDCLSRARQRYFHQRGEIRKAKRRYSKRVRRSAKNEIAIDILNNIRDMPPEFSKTVDENFWDII